MKVSAGGAPIKARVPVAYGHKAKGGAMKLIEVEAARLARAQWAEAYPQMAEVVARELEQDAEQALAEGDAFGYGSCRLAAKLVRQDARPHLERRERERLQAAAGEAGDVAEPVAAALRPALAAGGAR